MAGAKFKLGPAILQTSDSTAHAPDTWRTALLKLLDTASCAAFACTCKPAHSWLLEEWPEAALIVAVKPSTSEQPPRLLRRMQRARQQLTSRAKPTTLTLVQSAQMEASDAAWMVTITALSGVKVASLRLSLQHMLSEQLSFIAQALAGVQSLWLLPPTDLASTVQLPTPLVFAHLRHLTIGTVPVASQTGLWISLGPYLRQLESLTIAQQPEGTVSPTTLQPLWTSAFNALTRSRSLRRLVLPVDLSPWLAKLLQQHVPSLTELEVTGVSIEATGAQQVAAVCSWRTITLSNNDQFYDNSWGWLPVPQNGKLVVKRGKPDVKGSILLNVALPLSDAVAHKLTSIEFLGNVCLSITTHGVDPASQPAALRNALPILLPLQAPGYMTLLSSFTMSPGLAAELAALAATGAAGRISLLELAWPTDTVITNPLPALTTLHITSPLTNALAGQLAQCLTSVLQLKVPGLRLKTALPAGTRVPWSRVIVGENPRLGAWLAQVTLMGGDVEWELTDVYHKMTIAEVDNKEHERMTAQLRTVRLVSLNTAHISTDIPVITSKLHPTPNPLLQPHASKTEQARALQASLAVINALPCTPKDVHLHRWSTTGDVVTELRALPKAQTLGLHLNSPQVNNAYGQRTTYTGQSGAVARAQPLSRLPLVIPRSYTSIRVGTAFVQKVEAEALVFGAPADRTAGEPLAFVMDGQYSVPNWVSGLSAELAHVGNYPHVTVTAING